MKESQICLKLKNQLNKLPNSLFWKISDRFTAGIPDIIGCYNGLFVGIEVKMYPGKLTGLQALTFIKLPRNCFMISYNKIMKIYHINGNIFKTTEETVTCLQKQWDSLIISDYPFKQHRTESTTHSS